MDQTLTNLLGMARLDPSDNLVSVLADRLCEVSADDRREALQGLLMAALGFGAMASERCDRYGTKFSCSFVLPKGDIEYGNLDLQRANREHSRFDLMHSLARAIDNDHWYAIRLDYKEWPEASWRWALECVNHMATLRVLPLDGGQVREVGDA